MKKGLKTLLLGIVLFMAGAVAIPMALIVPLILSDREEERGRLWRARHDAAYAAKALRPGCEN